MTPKDWTDFATDAKGLKEIEEFIRYDPFKACGLERPKPKRDMGWEIEGPRFNGFRGHVSLCWFNCSFSYHGDHSPAFHVELGICNTLIFHVGYYNRNHEDDYS